MSYCNDERDALLRYISANPGDEAPIRVFSDWLEENDSPGTLRVTKCPRWMVVAWRRATKAARRAQWTGRRQQPDPAAGLPDGLGFLGPAVRDGGDVILEIEHNAEVLGFGPTLFDHVGTATVAGIENCLVSEPYGNFDKAVRAFMRLASFVGAIPVASREATWGSSCVRIALLPPLKIG